MHSRSIECAHDLIDIASAYSGRYPYLLDSAALGPLGEFSILLRCNGQHLSSHTDGRLLGPGSKAGTGPGHDETVGFLSRLDEWFQNERQAQSDVSEWPFIGGWFIYMGYELAAEIEPVVQFPPATDGFPVAFASRCPAAVYANPDQSGVLYVLAETAIMLDEVCDELENLQTRTPETVFNLSNLSVDQPGYFKSAVEKIHEYILDGDIFQVNLSREWQARFDQQIDARALYRALRKSNPAPFAGLIHWEDYVLMSSSPERLVHIANGQVQSRPIAGTRPRGRDSESDLALIRELLAHPKERAEHIMLIDLERNDLGRVCETGSVEVNELMVVESYEHVHHIVSNVRGRLRGDVTPVDVIRAVFPGGTITGCPKVRCMEIIAELEQHGRSFYTGSIGYLGIDGNMDLNILIRSMLLHQKKINFRTGAGIVADSEAQAEVEETEDKARGLLTALGSVHTEMIGG